jgi:preprotein translocase subunit YajC
VPASRLRQITSAIAHFIAGVLDRESMVRIVEELCRISDLQVGQRVKTLGGSIRGVIVRVLDDGRVAVRPDGAVGEMISLPENLLPEDSPGA